MSQTFGNNAITKLTADQPLSGVGSGVLQVLNGSAPFPNTGQTYTVRVDGELELVTGGFGTNTLTVSRGQESTAPALHVTGADVKQEISLGGMLSMGDGFWPFLRPAGLPGAVQPARFVGGSVGAPTSGTFLAGDFTVDLVGGVMWVCTIAGSPGTFLAVGGAPTGSLQMFAGAAAPSGWLLCDGTAVSRTTYAALFAVAGTTFGVGDGSTTFNLPDMRGRTAVGAGAVNTDLQPTVVRGGTTWASVNYGPSITGIAVEVLQPSQMPGHAHGGATGGETGHTHPTDNAYRANAGTLTVAPGGPNVANVHFSSAGSTGHIHGIPVEGGGAGHNLMQPFLGLSAIIKT